MELTDIKECMATIKYKRCEGFDRIPVCLLFNMHDVLFKPMAELFSKIYKTGNTISKFM